MIEVVTKLTTGALRCAKVQSSRQSIYFKYPFTHRFYSTTQVHVGLLFETVPVFIYLLVNYLFVALCSEHTKQ